MPRQSAGPELTVTDLRLIKQVYFAYVEFRIPFLPAAKWCYRAKALADRGYLKAIASSPPQPPGKFYDWARCVFEPTKPGLHAYNKQVRKLRKKESMA